MSYTDLVNANFKVGGRSFTQLLEQQVEQGPALFVNVPVGYAPYKEVISVITIGVTLGMSLFLGGVINR